MKPGDVLAERFVLRRELGRGATGVVWEAWDEPGDRPVACKVLHDALTDDPGALGVLEAESAAAGRLKHRGILEVHGLWAHEGRRLLITERVAGDSLAAREGAMHLEDALLVAEQVAAALVEAHRHGFVHGDVRPGNVLLTPTGAKLFDFGLATWVGSMEDTSATVRAGESAPEVLAGGPPRVTADLYGLGVVLVRAATGQLPWAGPTPYAVMASQRDRVSAFEELPRGVRALVRALLEPDPDRRPPDARTVHQALVELRRHPGRPVSLGGRWIAPVRPLKAWVVHGTDPATGGPCVIREGLPRRSAKALAARLQREGWSVQASREALDVVDLAWAGAVGLLFSGLIPLIGWILVVPLVLRWRSAPVRDRIREALPPVRTPLPPKQLPPGNEVAVAAGLLMFALVGSLVLFPPLSLPIAGLLAWLAWTSWNPVTDREAERARSGRIETALAEAVALIESRELDLDSDLALYGEWSELERAWRSGTLDGEAVLVRAEDLSRRARALRGGALSRLPRPHDEPDVDAP